MARLLNVITGRSGKKRGPYWTRKRRIQIIGEQTRSILSNDFYYEYSDVRRLVSMILGKLDMCDKPHLIIREILDKGFIKRIVVDGKTFWRARFD